MNTTMHGDLEAAIDFPQPFDLDGGDPADKIDVRSVLRQLTEHLTPSQFDGFLADLGLDDPHLEDYLTRIAEFGDDEPSQEDLDSVEQWMNEAVTEA